MRKLLIIFISIVLILSLCACGNLVEKSEAGGVSSSSGVSDVSSNDALNEHTNPVSEETLSDKLIREIHEEYLKALDAPENGTTARMIEVANTYTKKWVDVADQYYAEIVSDEDTSDGVQTALSTMKADFEDYYNSQCENYRDFLSAAYGEASISRLNFAMFEYNLQKDWALQIVGIYEQLNIK